MAVHFILLLKEIDDRHSAECRDKVLWRGS